MAARRLGYPRRTVLNAWLNVRAQLVRRSKRGSGAFCPCCGCSQSSFRDLVMPDRQCWVCGSLERHRLIALWMDATPGLFHPGMRILHVAPEWSLARRLRRIPSVRYVAGDLTQEFGAERIDVTDLRYPDSSFDAVICNHVLEHIPADELAMRELCRVLKPNGWALLLVPDVYEPHTHETPGITDPEAMLRLYGQRDHVRRYGWDYVDRLAGAGFRVDVIQLETAVSEEMVNRCRLRKSGQVEPLFVGRKSVPTQRMDRLSPKSRLRTHPQQLA